MRKSLLWRLVGVNLLVIVFVMSVMWLAVNYLAAGYFMVLMEKYHISPTESHQMFIGAVHRYLIWASAAAFVLALALSSVLTRRLLRPLTDMTGTAQRIAEGDYTGKVPVVSHDEVGRLSEAFNRMSASLRHTEQLRKRMVIDVAHELRTPLTNIQGIPRSARGRRRGPFAGDTRAAPGGNRTPHLPRGRHDEAGQGRRCPGRSSQG